MSLTDQGAAARAEAEQIPAAIMERLGMELGELEDLRDSLNRLIDATRTPVSQSSAVPAV